VNIKLKIFLIYGVCFIMSWCFSNFSLFRRDKVWHYYFSWKCNKSFFFFLFLTY